jgi:hypothetical protein
MVSSVSYPSTSAVFAFAARMANAGYTAKFCRCHPVNYIQEIKGQLEFLKHGGYANDPKSGYEGLKNLLATLQQMQGTTSSVNVTA